MKLANSVFFGSRNRILTAKQALVQLGIVEIRKWIYLVTLKDIHTIENRELIKNCYIRAKFMEQLAIETGKKDKSLEYFITGMFSAIDVLLNKDMDVIMNEINLPCDVKDALLGVKNEIRKVLDMVLDYESLKWNVLDTDETSFEISQEKFMSLYLEALAWARKLKY